MSEPARVATPRRPPPAPAHLAADGRRLWRRVQVEYQLDDAAGGELLRLACEALDRCAQARAILASQGLTIEGRFGAKTHPAVAIERDSALRAARLLRELGVAVDAPDSRSPAKWRS